MTQAPRPWHAVSIDETLASLEVDPTRGLEVDEASARRDREGSNSLPSTPRPSLARRIVRQFSDVTVLALLAAAVIAVVVGARATDEALLSRYGDALAIGLIVILNAVIGLVQEGKAERALASLDTLSPPVASVRRGGGRHRVLAEELVPGDVVVLSKGDRVPADVRLIEAVDLSVSEAILTGESMPVEKRATGVLADDEHLAERTNMTFSGTLVAHGRGEGIVVGTGAGSELGRLATMLSTVEVPTTPLQRRLQRFGRNVVLGCVAVALVVFVVGLARGQASMSEMLLTAVSLAVAAIPEGLPAVTTIVLALGVQRMARRHAIVRRLSAVETLGSADVICTDKTGTLTENRMRVRRLWTPGGEAVVSTSEDRPQVQAEDGRSAGSLDLAALVLGARAVRGAHVAASGEVVGEPTDIALLELGRGLSEGREEPRLLFEVPFDSDRKRAAVAVDAGDGPLLLVHGAAEALIERSVSIASASSGGSGGSGLTPHDRDRLREIIERWAETGLRVLGLAQRRIADDGASSKKRDPNELERELELVGLVGLSDPPRAEVPEALQKATDAGVRTVMITGDHPRTASSIAREIGLDAPPGSVVTGSELERLSAQELEQRAEGVRVIARATAEVKLRFVEALKARGRTVAMTGDGVNDAPALKAATIGVAMGRGGTDVAREASDLILTDDNYATIIAAIEEGRVIFSNIRRFIVFLLSVNTGLVVAVLVSALAGWPALLVPTQILWINLITNGLPALALGMEPSSRDPMAFGPRSGEAIVRRGDLIWLGAHGLVMAALGLGVFVQSRATGLSDDGARTMAFIVLAMGPLFHALSCRSRDRSVFQVGFFRNGRLWGAFVVALGLQALALFVPVLRQVFHTVLLSPEQLAWALGLSALVLVIGELEKAVRRLLGGGASGGSSRVSRASSAEGSRFAPHRRAAPSR